MATWADVERWARLADAATPGPWDVKWWEADKWDPENGKVVGPMMWIDYEDWGYSHRPDVDLMAAAREAVPAMADMLERAAAIIARDGDTGWTDTRAWLREWNGEVDGGHDVADGAGGGAGATD